MVSGYDEKKEKMISGGKVNKKGLEGKTKGGIQ